MGKLFYGADRTAIDVDDVLLRHLELVFTAKLRRNESFLLSWEDNPSVGDGRSAVWIHPAIELHYKYRHGKTVEIDRELLEELTRASASNGGLNISNNGTLTSNPV